MAAARRKNAGFSCALLEMVYSASSGASRQEQELPLAVPAQLYDLAPVEPVPLRVLEFAVATQHLSFAVVKALYPALAAVMAQHMALAVL